MSPRAKVKTGRYVSLLFAGLVLMAGGGAYFAFDTWARKSRSERYREAVARQQVLVTSFLRKAGLPVDHTWELRAHPLMGVQTNWSADGAGSNVSVFLIRDGTRVMEAQVNGKLRAGVPGTALKDKDLLKHVQRCYVPFVAVKDPIVEIQGRFTEESPLASGAPTQVVTVLLTEAGGTGRRQILLLNDRTGSLIELALQTKEAQ